MPFLRRNKKPQPARPPVALTWRRPRPTHPALTSAVDYAAHMGAFEEDALSLSDALTARDRREDERHGC
jgi:hypothetical protein